MAIRTQVWLVAPFMLACVGCSSSDEEGSSLTQVSMPLAINEFSVTGSTEWIEISNYGTGAIDLGGYGITDTNKKTLLPKTDTAMRFPTGTKIEPGGHIIILLDQDDDPGPYDQASCLTNGPSTCFHATFGVSAASSETVHLLRSDNAVISSVSYPGSLSPDPTTQTVCRLPDSTGDLQLCAATPGATNGAP